MLRRTKTAGSDRAREQAQRQADALREEFGRIAFEMAEDYFPEEAKARRRKAGTKVFGVGLLIGLLVGLIAGRQ